MKVRSDFVTNSSSSSFILGFTSEDKVRNELYDGLYDGEKYFFDRIYKDVMEAKRLSADEAESIIRNYLKYYVKWELASKHPGGWSRVFEETEEFEQECKQAIEEHIDKIKDKLMGQSVLVEVEYGDHVDGVLEHEVMPSHPSSIYRMSHH